MQGSRAQTRLIPKETNHADQLVRAIRALRVRSRELYIQKEKYLLIAFASNSRSKVLLYYTSLKSKNIILNKNIVLSYYIAYIIRNKNIVLSYYSNLLIL